MQNVGSKSLGYLLDNWNRVAYRCPAIEESSLVYWAHEDGELWPGIEVVNGKVNIIDYKTNKEIKKESYVDWDGKSEKMSPPVDSLDDCNFCKGDFLTPSLISEGLNTGTVTPSLSIEAKEHKSVSL